MNILKNDVCWADPALWVAITSTIISLLAFFVSVRVANTEKKKNFEQTVEECFMPVSSFIHDSFYVLSNKTFDSIDKMLEGEKQLVEGIHRLYVYATTNRYKYLKEATTIRLSEENDEINIKSFSYCLLTLEDKYMKFREKRVSGKLSKPNEKVLIQMNIHFRNYLDLLAKYMFVLMHNYCKKINSYYEELATLYSEVEKL